MMTKIEKLQKLPTASQLQMLFHLFNAIPVHKRQKALGLLDPEEMTVEQRVYARATMIGLCAIAGFDINVVLAERPDLPDGHMWLAIHGWRECADKLFERSKRRRGSTKAPTRRAA